MFLVPECDPTQRVNMFLSRGEGLPVPGSAFWTGLGPADFTTVV
jgi:hypothetical protein